MFLDYLALASSFFVTPFFSFLKFKHDVPSQPALLRSLYQYFSDNTTTVKVGLSLLASLMVRD